MGPPPSAQDHDGAPNTGANEIVLLNRDLFFGVRVANTLRQRGYAVSVCATTDAFVERLRSAQPPAVLGILDLAAGIEWDRLREFTGDDEHPTPLLLFGPHKDVDGLRAAKAAGVDRVVSNGEFHRNMIALVERYALPGTGHE